MQPSSVYSFFWVGGGGGGVEDHGARDAAFVIQSGPFSALRSRIPPGTDLVDEFQLAAEGQESLLLCL